ncbi:hypothetical protein CAter10_1544 [Collimonas arenae]|nr:hypothetical protein CAter10_1544 [Collimonas arenae]
METCAILATSSIVANCALSSIFAGASRQLLILSSQQPPQPL